MKKYFKNIKISKKLSIGFLIVSCLGVIIGLVGIFSLLKNLDTMKTTYNKCTMGIKSSYGTLAEFYSLRTSTRNMYIYYDNNRQKYIYECKSKISDIETQINNEQTAAGFSDSSNGNLKFYRI